LASGHPFSTCNFSFEASASRCSRARVGFYRLQINAFQAERLTFDNQTSADGRGDEIYIGSAAYVNSRLATIAISAIHGDVGAPPIPLPGAPSRAGRVQAGTASATGGIWTSDIVPYTTNPGFNPGGPVQTAYRDRFPLIAWEGWLGGDTAVEISPSIWESDGDLTAFNEWQTLMIGQCDRKERELVEEQYSDDKQSEAGGSIADAFREELRDADQQRQLLQTTNGLEQTIAQMRYDSAEREADLRAREHRDADASKEKLHVENGCPDAKESLPDFLLPFTILTGQGKDRYIGTISRKPLLRFSTATPLNSQTLQFVDPDANVPLLGSYRIWLAFFPI
jgi:hypothetical protein